MIAQTSDVLNAYIIFVSSSRGGGGGKGVFGTMIMGCGLIVLYKTKLTITNFNVGLLLDNIQDKWCFSFVSFGTFHHVANHPFASSC